MRRVKLAGLTLIVVLAVGAIAAGTASASKKLVLSEAGIALAPGAEFYVYGEDNLLIRSSYTNIECPEQFQGATLELQVLSNSKSTDELSVKGGGAFLGGNCRTSAGHGHAELSISTGPLKLRATGKATIAGPIVLRIEFESPNIRCYFKTGALRGTSSVDATRARLEMEFPGKKLSIDRAFTNAEECPKSVIMTVGFDRSEAGLGEIEAQVF